MTQGEIVEKLRDIMRQSTQEEVNWDEVTPESTIASLGFDSLSILDLIYDIQQAFGIDFDAEELTTVDTVADLASFLEAKGV